jgi:ATPase subunit of ABC transporter with duplicated ATPase domains
MATVSSLLVMLAVCGLNPATLAFSPGFHSYTKSNTPKCLSRNKDSPLGRSKRTRLASSTAPATNTLGVTKGDTKGANLLLTDLYISTGGGEQILKAINFRVDPKERWGIVGPNGCGKSTLLGAITGSVRIDDGKALVASKTKVGYLKQTAVSGSTKTVREEAASEMEEINSVKRQLDELESKISNGDSSEKTLNGLAKAQDRFEDVGGWTQDQDVDQVLKGLGFQPFDSDRLCSDFSGGWQMRIALARLLLSRPDLLLLDEPSNHLDSSARDWLATYLSNYLGSILLVSHDVALLTKSVNSIAEIGGKSLTQYVSCNYDKYLSEKEFRLKSATAEYERNMKEAARLQDFVDKWGASATKATAAQSRVKMIEKMRKEGKLDPPPTALTQKRWKPSLVLPDPPKGIGEELLVLKGADVGWVEEGAPPILEGIDLVVNRGMKLILRGPNGAGECSCHLVVSQYYLECVPSRHLWLLNCPQASQPYWPHYEGSYRCLQESALKMTFFGKRVSFCIASI